MSSTTDYLDRIKNIRQKYGCSQDKQTHNNCSTLYVAHQKNASSMYQNIGLQIPDRKKYINSSTTAPGSTHMRSDYTSDYNMRPQSSISIGNQKYANEVYSGTGQDFQNQLSRQRQIDQIRQKYAASRKKITNDIPQGHFVKEYQQKISKNYEKDYKKSEAADYLRSSQRSNSHNFSHQRTYGFNDPLRYTRNSLQQNAQQSISPIKKMTDYQNKRSFKQIDPQIPSRVSDNFWRQRQAKLSQMTMNRLNENNRSLFKYQKNAQSKLLPSKRSGIYSDTIKPFNETYGLSKKNIENKICQDYSVSNIDKIQQRIQSILNKK